MARGVCTARATYVRRNGSVRTKGKDERRRVAAFGPEGGPIDKIHADTSFQYRYALFSYQFPIIMFRNAAPSLAVEDRLCHSAARRALPTKRIHSLAVPEGIWRGTSYYLVERSQHDVEARAEENCCGSGSFMLDGMKEERRRALGGKSTLGRRRIEKKFVD